MQLPVRRAKKTKQTLNIRAESKILRNEIKVITKPSKEMYITWIYLKKKNKADLSSTWKSICSIASVGRKV